MPLRSPDAIAAVIGFGVAAAAGSADAAAGARTSFSGEPPGSASGDAGTSAMRCSCLVERVRRSRAPAEPVELEDRSDAAGGPAPLLPKPMAGPPSSPILWCWGERCGAEEAKPCRLSELLSVGRERMSERNTLRSSRPSRTEPHVPDGPAESASVDWPGAESHSASPLDLARMLSVAFRASVVPRSISAAARGSTSVIPLLP
mmetsp:Transcript_22214/g.69810  ORF Transcript_22214/g.69810 Transcript_22214/m.69810 type:complete len:203 (-) Transcript_22214:230-838(-)